MKVGYHPSSVYSYLVQEIDLIFEGVHPFRHVAARKPSKVPRAKRIFRQTGKAPSGQTLASNLRLATAARQRTRPMMALSAPSAVARQCSDARSATGALAEPYAMP